MLRYLLFLPLIFCINIFSDLSLSSPKIKLNDKDQRIIEFKIENASIKDGDIILNEYKTNNPIDESFIAYTLINDYGNYQTFTIVLDDEYLKDYFSFKILIKENFAKDIFIYLPSKVRNTFNNSKPNKPERISSETAFSIAKSRSEASNKLEQAEKVEPEIQEIEIIKGSEISTVWNMAEKIKGQNQDISIYQIMWSIFLENPESFIDGNINLVRADLDLVIPPKEIVDSVDLDYAKSAFIQMNKAFENMNKSRLVLTAPKNIIQLESSNSDQLSESPQNIINPNLSSPKEIVESNLRIINFENKTTLKQTDDMPEPNQNNLLQILIVGLVSFILGAIISIFLIRKRQPRINETTDSINTDQIIDNELSIENDNEMQMLDLARIYIEMGSYDEAKGILDQLISNSNNLQIQADASLLKNKLEN